MVDFLLTLVTHICGQHVECDKNWALDGLGPFTSQFGSHLGRRRRDIKDVGVDMHRNWRLVISMAMTIR